MTHSSVVTLLEDTAKSLGDNVRFGYGALDDFNSISNKVFPFIWLNPLKGEFMTNDSGPNSTVDFECELFFMDADNPKGAERDTADTWDKSHDLMSQFVFKLNRFIMDDSEYTDDISSNLVLLENVRFESGRKATGDALSGWTLKFNLLVPVEFDYCSIYES